jgi:hypothetical protein
LRLGARQLRETGCGRHLTASQRGCVAADAEPLYARETKERQRAAGGDKRSEKAKKSVPEKFPEPIGHAPEAREQAAKAVGVNPHYVTDAKAIKEKAPQVFERVKERAGGAG